MPKRRKPENRKLPERWRWRFGALYYRVPPGQEHLWDGKTEFRLGKTEREAYRVWQERLREPGQLRTVHQIIDRYLAEVIPGKAPKTQESNRIAIDRLRPVFGGMSPGGIKPSHVYRYFDLVRNKHGHTSAKRDIETLRHMLTKAVEWGATDRNPLIGQLRLPNPPPRQYLPTAADIAAALEHAPPLLNQYLRFKLMTGLRRGDILRLTVADIHADGLHVMPSKTQNSTAVQLVFEWSPEFRQLVTEIVAGRTQGPLFATRDGAAYIRPDGSANAFDSLWQRFMAKLVGLGVQRFQERDLRAVVASDSPTLQDAADRLGHADTRITARVYRRKPRRITPLCMG